MRGIKTVIAATLLVLAFAFGNTPAMAGLRAAWSFEEGDGASVYDSSANHNLGVVRGDPKDIYNNNLHVAYPVFERRDGQTGKALYFKNKSFIEAPDTDDLRMDGPFTLEGRWLYAPNATQVLFFKGVDANRCNYSAVVTGGEIAFSCTDVNGTVWTVRAKAPPAGEWHLLDFVYDGQALLIYIDRALAATLKTGAVRLMTDIDFGLLIGANRVFRVGLNKVSASGPAGVDEFRIYDEALDPERMGQALEKRAEVSTTASEPKSLIQRTLRYVGLKKERLTVTKDGKAAAAIVIRKGYTELQSVPAKELQRYIEKLTGARLPILEDDTAYSGNMILVGESRYTRELGIETGKMQGDSYVMRSFPGRLVLAGHDDILEVPKPQHDPEELTWAYQYAFMTVKNGTLNAVYAFLQDYCGVRWFMPGKLWEHIPERHDLEVSGLNIEGQPYRDYVRYDYGFYCYNAWNARNFMGESVRTFAFDMQHNWALLIPWSRYHAAHPEWFAMRDGKRNAQSVHGASLCTSNHEMWETALKNLKAIYDQGFERVTVMQSDGYLRCQCPDCEAMDNYRLNGYYIPGVPADRIWIFHDYLAREIQKAYPDRKIMLDAYGPTGEIPGKLAKLPDNVIMEINLNDTNKDRGLLERWRKYHPAPYNVFFVYWFCPEVNTRLPHSYDYIAQEVKTLMTTYNGRALFLCGGGNVWNANGPIYYMIARLMRNPQEDAGAILDEFCASLFGRAGGAMRDYFTALYGGSQRLMDYMLKKYKDAETNTGDGETVIGATMSLREQYLVAYPDDVLAVCERELSQARAEADTDTIKKRIAFFADAFEALKLTAQGFRQTAEGDLSKAMIQQLIRRNSFIAEVSKRLQVEQYALMTEGYTGPGKGFELFSFVQSINTNDITDKGDHVAILMGGYGAAGIIGVLTNAGQKYCPVFATVWKDKHPAYIVAQPKSMMAYNNGIEQLREYVKNGGAVMLTHDAVGCRGLKAAFPEIGRGAEQVADANAVIAANHEITSGMKTGDSFKHAYFDHIVLEKGPQGTVICADTKGRSVMVVGSFGKGKVILNGMAVGYASVNEGDYSGKDKEPEGMERQLLLNSVNWLKAR